jgi:hypothetical protein
VKIALAAALLLLTVDAASPPPAEPARYTIDDHLVIHAADGAALAAVMVRRADAPARQPAALKFTIYARPTSDIQRMKYAADRGYVAVTAYSRGKAWSPEAVAPYEFDGRDATGVIEWIQRQPWSNGKVGMYGGSYDGFTQWAAAKWMPRALKTIVPYVAENPGNGLPMQNNVFLLVNYPWIYYVTDNRLLDDAAYGNKIFRSLNERWYASGIAYEDVDTLAGRPNPWLRKWLAHPSYDEYWQSMLPFRREFARINIPVLAIDGYYDDGQLSALGFFRDLYAYNRHANGYLVIGPWVHFGSQHAVKDPVLRGYRIDPAAQISTPKLTFDWFDYVMRGAPRPSLVKDRVNFEDGRQSLGARAFARSDDPFLGDLLLNEPPCGRSLLPALAERAGEVRIPSRVRRLCRPQDDERQRLLSRSHRSKAPGAARRIRFHHGAARPSDDAQRVVYRNVSRDPQQARRRLRRRSLSGPARRQALRTFVLHRSRQLCSRYEPATAPATGTNRIDSIYPLLPRQPVSCEGQPAFADP